MEERSKVRCMMMGFKFKTCSGSKDTSSATKCCLNCDGKLRSGEVEDRLNFACSMKKVVITGPESSGKTTLAEALAAHVNGGLVREMVRTYFAERTRATSGYEEAELRTIAQLQLQEEERIAELTEACSGRILVCDTDLITIRIWGEEKFGRSDPWILKRTEQRVYDLWLLCRPDMPWEPDLLRENPNDRDRLFDVYESTLKQLRKPYVVIEGGHEQRLQCAMEAVAFLFRT